MDFYSGTSLAWELRYRWTRTRFTKVADPEVGGQQSLDMAVVKKSVHPASVAGWIMAFGVERQPRRSWWNCEPTI